MYELKEGLFYEINVKKGWNLIGVTNECVINDLNNLINSNTAFQYDGTYNQLGEIKDNIGFWIECNENGIIEVSYNEEDVRYQWTESGIAKLKSDSDTALNSYLLSQVKGQLLTRFTYSQLEKFGDRYRLENLLDKEWIIIYDSEIALQEGWNLFGTSYNCAISDPEELIVSGTVFKFDEGYINIDDGNLDKDYGYWIKASKSGTIRLINSNPIR